MPACDMYRASHLGLVCSLYSVNGLFLIIGALQYFFPLVCVCVFFFVLVDRMSVW